MSEESYYKTLGVPENASQDEIKKAYRKMSLKYHPDKNQGDPTAESTFKKINEAFQVIGDADERKKYDMQNSNPFMRMNSMGGFGQEFENIDELFANIFFGGGMGGMPGMPGPMGGMPGGMPFGANPNIRVFHNGMPVNIGMRQNMAQNLQKPTPIIKSVTISMEQVLTGANVPVEIERWIVENGHKVFEQETLYVTVNKGVDDNEIIILREKGNVLAETCKGDVKVFIKVENNTDFQRRGLDLILIKTISLKEALCGFSFELKYVNNKIYTINNNSGNIIKPGYEKVIPNMGLVRDGHTGNLVIVFQVDFPDKLEEEKLKALKDLL
jgi:DnaJ-class molecular chaperone